MPTALHKECNCSVLRRMVADIEITAEVLHENLSILRFQPKTGLEAKNLLRSLDLTGLS